MEELGRVTLFNKQNILLVLLPHGHKLLANLSAKLFAFTPRKRSSLFQPKISEAFHSKVNMTLVDAISSILGLIPLNSNNTTVPPPADYSSSFLFREVYVVCSIGIPLNLFVIYLSFFHKSIKNNYKYLVGNVAVCDILLLGSLLNYNLVHMYVVDNDLMYTPVFVHFIPNLVLYLFCLLF